MLKRVRLLHHRNRTGRLKVTMPLTNRPVPMSNSLRLQDRMEGLIEQHLPPLRKTRHRNLARLLTGLYRAEHVHLSAMADELPGPAQQTSKTRRMRRFVNNEEVNPSRCYRPVARSLLREASQSGPLRLLVDRLELSGQRRLLVAALAYRRRALPILWRVQRQTGATGAELQTDFLEELAKLVPPEAEVILIGDGEFHSVDLLRAAKQVPPAKAGGTAYAFTRTLICERARESRGGNAGPWIQTKESADTSGMFRSQSLATLDRSI